MGNLITKREVLHLVAQVYDPLGWFQPVTIRGRMFFQELWKDKFKWDDPLPADKLETWVDIVAELGKIKTVNIPRWFGKEGKQELCFCDASKRCYATVIYLRTEDSSGKANCKLVFAKGRLAPQKELSIPRMELMVILIGVRSLQFVNDQIKKPIVDLKLWSDSKCALCWIKSKKENCLFVDNRVKEIRTYQDVSFRYVSTTENPADLITRGKRVRELSDAWWHGPIWLKKAKSQWPESDVGIIDEETLQQVEKEQKKNNTVMYEAGLVGEEESNGIATVSPFGIDLSRHSDLTKVPCVTAWYQRFVDKTRRLSKDVGNFLTTKEIFAAKQMWEKHDQAKCYHKKVKDIGSARSSNGLVQSLGLNLDDKGLIRCYGRLGNSSLEFGCVNPKLLPPKERFTELVVQDFHERVLHSGVLQTLSAVRGKYWIPKGRAQVKRFIGRCLKCKRYEGGAYQLPQVPSLPRERVTRSAPFKFTGADYFGPLFIRGTEGVSKIWVCLFTCMAVRAVHLELASYLSAESFLMCLKRFVARRGRPLKIISDNGTHFCATRKMFDSMQRSLSVQGITWVHIVEWAPWMGGFYERLIGIVKRILKKSLGPLCLRYEQLLTLLTEIEAIVNSRPLTYMGSEIETGYPIYPVNFLSINCDQSFPSVDDSDLDDANWSPVKSTKDSLLSTWKKGQKHLDLFWDRWIKEYLLNLREKSTSVKQKIPASDIKIRTGQVVLLKNSQVSRGCWKLGKVLDLNTSKDGKVRSAKIKMNGKESTKSIAHLYPLECENECENCLKDKKQAIKEELKPVTTKVKLKAKEKIDQYYRDIEDNDSDSN